MVNDRGKLVIPSTTRRYQAQAADPRRSIWVGANAGSGKTFVLTQRVLRLLLTGVNPQSILCLTYTKAAAAEMRKRVGARLAEWAVSPAGLLRARLRDKVFRIGHLGDFNDLMLMGTLAGIEMGLELAGVPHKKGGVDAAMEYLARGEAAPAKRLQAVTTE